MCAEKRALIEEFRVFVHHVDELMEKIEALEKYLGIDYRAYSPEKKKYMKIEEV